MFIGSDDFMEYYTVSAVMERDFILNKDRAIKLLELHLDENIDWAAEIARLRTNLQKKLGKEDVMREVKTAIACAVLGQEKAAMRFPDNPKDALHLWHLWSPFNENPDEWLDMLKEYIERDEQIEQWRAQCLSLGVIAPLEYSPVTRQAFNWLYGKAQDYGCVTEANKQKMVRRFQNLVRAYGGNVICYLFMKEEFKIGKKVLNWNSNYFFEHLIFDVYSVDQVMKIKKQELAKTNPKLVQSVRID